MKPPAPSASPAQGGVKLSQRTPPRPWRWMRYWGGGATICLMMTNQTPKPALTAFERLQAHPRFTRFVEAGWRIIGPGPEHPVTVAK